MSVNSIHLVNGYYLDLARGCLTRSGVPVHLRRQSYEVLKYLVENRGHLIRKDKLIEQVWEGRAVTDGSLGKCIEEIRAALGGEAGKYLRNERGRGYIFEPEEIQSTGTYALPHRATSRTRLATYQTVHPQAYLAGALAAGGQKKEALQIVDKLNRTRDYVSPTELAAVYAQLKDDKAAITLLEKAYAERDLQLGTLNIDRSFDGLRTDSRFQEIVRRVGLRPFAVAEQN